jgi:RNA polymerase sigma factor (sigma-70 family)
MAVMWAELACLEHSPSPLETPTHPEGVLAHVAGWLAPPKCPTAGPDATDEALMAAFCAGHEGAFETLFGRHAEPIRRLALRLTGDRALAIDLTQTTFLSVVRGRGRFRPGSLFKPWLYAIAMNALRDHRRRARREVLDKAGVLPEGSYEASWRDHGLEREVHGALARLPPEQREAVVLHQFEGFSFHEIAQMLEVTETAVKVRAHRGYERLRALLKDTWVGHA